MPCPGRSGSRCCFSRSYRCHVAAIDVEALTGDVGSGVTAEEDCGTHEIVGMAEAAHRDLVQHGLLPSRVLIENIGEGGAEIAGTYGVDPDAARRPFRGQRPRHA